VRKPHNSKETKQKEKKKEQKGPAKKKGVSLWGCGFGRDAGEGGRGAEPATGRRRRFGGKNAERKKSSGEVRALSGGVIPSDANRMGGGVKNGEVGEWSDGGVVAVVRQSSAYSEERTRGFGGCEVKEGKKVQKGGRQKTGRGRGRLVLQAGNGAVRPRFV